MRLKSFVVETMNFCTSNCFGFSPSRKTLRCRHQKVRISTKKYLRYSSKIPQAHAACTFNCYKHATRAKLTEIYNKLTTVHFPVTCFVVCLQHMKCAFLHWECFQNVKLVSGFGEWAKLFQWLLDQNNVHASVQAAEKCVFRSCDNLLEITFAQKTTFEHTYSRKRNWIEIALYFRRTQLSVKVRSEN